MNPRVFMDRSVGAQTGATFVAHGSDPLEIISAHHRFQLALCNFLEALSSNLHQARAGEFAGIMSRYLEEEFPLHQENEVSDLREALEVHPDFGAEEAALFDLVEESHRRDRRLAAPVTEGLSRLASGDFPVNPRGFVIALIQFAESLRRHINWEERVIVPLAAEFLQPDTHGKLLECLAERGNRLESMGRPAFRYLSKTGTAHGGDRQFGEHNPQN